MSDWIRVLTVQGNTKASVIKGRFESEGIPVNVEYEAIGKVAAISVDGIGAVRISVPKEFEERAREILREAGEIE